MLSVIIPVYNEIKNLELLGPKLIDVLNGLHRNYEIIYIDDGSKDESKALLKNFALDNDKVKIISLVRNFGQTLAIQAGLDHSKGDIVIFMDADFQNDPLDIPQLLNKLDEGYDVVSGWRMHRKDSLFSKKIPSFIANSLISLLFGVKIHDLGCALKVYRRSVLANMRLYGDMHRLLPLYAAIQGARIAEVKVNHNSRHFGKTHYGWSRIFKVTLDLITARFFETYSTKPIHFFGGAGACLMGMGIILGAWVAMRTIFFQGQWVSPLLFISLMFFTMGLQLIFMGLLAEIIVRIYYKPKKEDVKAYLVKEIFQKTKD